MSRFLALLLLAAPLAAQDSKGVAALIEDLDSESVEVRESAEAALKKMGKEACAAVEEALRSGKSAEARARLRDILGYLKVPHAGGTIVDGLRFQLIAGKNEVRPGEGITLKVVLWNISPRPRNLYVGYSTGGVDFVSGNAFEVLAPKEETPSKPGWRVGFCGTGAGPIFTTIPAYGSQTFETTITFFGASKPGAPDAKGRPLNEKAHYAFPTRYLAIEAPQGEVHRLRVRHEVAREWQMSGTGRGIRQAGKPPFDERADPWTGTAWSNEVEIKILPAKD